MYTQEVLKKDNTVASACRDWLEIILFRVLSWIRKTPNLKPISIRAAAIKRHDAPLGGGARHVTTTEVTIKGVARHPRIPGHVHFRWDTTIIDTPTFRRIGERIGTGQFEYLGLKRSFMLETSRDGMLWLRMLTARGEPSSIRYSMGRGKMTPRSVDYE